MSWMSSEHYESHASSHEDLKNTNSRFQIIVEFEQDILFAIWNFLFSSMAKNFLSGLSCLSNQW